MSIPLQTWISNMTNFSFWYIFYIPKLHRHTHSATYMEEFFNVYTFFCFT